jgi:hypothetical protein
MLLLLPSSPGGVGPSGERGGRALPPSLGGSSSEALGACAVGGCAVGACFHDAGVVETG